MRLSTRVKFTRLHNLFSIRVQFDYVGTGRKYSFRGCFNNNNIPIYSSTLICKALYVFNFIFALVIIHTGTRKKMISIISIHYSRFYARK